MPDSLAKLRGAMECAIPLGMSPKTWGLRGRDEGSWVSARRGELGIIPGSMSAKSFIVHGKGNEDSFHSCSHGTGRTMSCTEAKRRFTPADQIKASEGIECRKDVNVIDEARLRGGLCRRGCWQCRPARA